VHSKTKEEEEEEETKKPLKIEITNL